MYNKYKHWRVGRMVMKVIRFRRFNNKNWEIAFNEKELYEKLNGDMAEIIMPEKSFIERLKIKLFPMKFIEGSNLKE